MVTREDSRTFTLDDKRGTMSITTQIGSPSPTRQVERERAAMTAPSRGVAAALFVVRRYTNVKGHEPMENNAEFVTLAQAVRLIGTTRPALNRRIEAGDLEVFGTGKDRRLKLVARADLDELVRIKPLTRDPVRVA
jgi:hypothetical protein